MKFNNNARLLTLVVSLTFSAQFAIAEGLPLCHKFLGQTHRMVTLASPLTGVGTGLNETQFNEVAEKIDRLYRAEFANLGGTLAVNRDWPDEAAEASANELGSTWAISLSGGLARQSNMTRDAFALAACHEIGHHLGGTPNQILSPLTSEGQADYYATLKCTRRFFADEDNAAALRGKMVDSFMLSECRAHFANANDQLICVRSNVAALTLVHVLEAVNQDATRVSFRTPDPSEPFLISNPDHPAAQCRLDTFFNGARCTEPVTSALSESSYWPGTCDREGQPANFGSRPRCWFKP